MALAAADEAQRSGSSKNAEAVKAFELAGWAAEKRIEYAEAEAENHALIKLEEKVLGPEHFETLSTCFGLAGCLNAEGAKQEAGELAQRAPDGARKVLGPDHPDTKKYEQLLEELVAKED